MTDTDQYCVMKISDCDNCNGTGYLSSPYDDDSPFCPRCAGTGKAWEPVPLAEALTELLDEQYWKRASQGYQSWKEAGGTPHISKEE